MPSKAYYRAHRERLAEQERARYYARQGRPTPQKSSRRPRKVSSCPVPLVDVPSGHPAYEEARKVLLVSERAELDREMDHRARDVLQEFVLAMLEGRDPVEAVRAYRKRDNRDRKWLVHGLDLTTDLVR